MKVYDKDIIMSIDNLIFVVIGNAHYKNRIITGLKYFPIEGKKYSKKIKGTNMARFDIRSDSKSLRKIINHIKKKYPNYIFHSKYYNTLFFGVKTNNIAKIFNPYQKLRNLRKKYEDLDNLQRKAVELAQLLSKEANVPFKKIGVTASILLDCHSPTSDIDIVIKGNEEFRKVITVLRESNIKNISWWTEKEWIKYYHIHNLKLGISPAEFAWHQRKHDKGLYKGSEFSVFGVRENINYITDNKSAIKPIGQTTIKAKVTDSSESGLRPGYYYLEDVRIISGKKPKNRILRIVNYDREYVLQAEDGEKIAARGLLEHVTFPSEYYQVTIGYLNSYLYRKKNNLEFIKVVG
jgi:predicted nucleotidyltransferase